MSMSFVLHILIIFMRRMELKDKKTPYTPQQNGVAKQMNKMLMERARSMLSRANLEKNL
jgi:hypothetical protein